MAPRRPPNGVPEAVQITSCATLAPRWSQSSSKTTPGDQISMFFFRFGLDFHSFWGRFWDGLGRLLEYICFLCCSFRSMLNQVSHALATKTGPRRAQNRTKTPLLAHLGHLCATSCQEGPNLKPTSAKMGQLVAKIAQNSSPSSSRPPPHPSKTKQK